MESPEIYSEIIFEILTRTSLKTLDRCRLVCKEWNHLTYESSFTPLHCQRTSTISGFFIQQTKLCKSFIQFVSINNDSGLGSSSGFLSLDFLPGDVEIAASSNQGILCCVSRNYPHYRYYVCKPSTRQLRVLPNPKMRYFTVKVAMVVLRSNPLRYQIVRFSLPRILSTYYCNFRCEIFDSEIWKWRELEDVLLPHGVLFTNKNAVVAGAVIYFLMNNNQVLGFHDETYTIFSLPEAVCNNGKYKNKQLLEYRGRLGLVCKAPEGYLELWIMEDYKNREWKRRQMLRINESVKDDLFPVAFYNADIALMKGFKRVGFYKFQDSNFNIVNLNVDPSEVFAFRSDPEPTNLNNRI